MFNAQQLLGTLLGTGMGGLNRRSFGAGGRGGILDAFGGAGGGLGGMGGGLGALAGIAGMSGVGGRLGRGAGLALLGAMALKALNERQQRQNPAAPARSWGDADDPETAISDSEAMLLIRAMVAAANADGRIDRDEETQILGKLDEAGASEEERAFVARELKNPVALDTLLREVEGPEMARQFYAASVIATRADTPAEQSYLRYLADRLEIDADEVAALNAQLGVGKG